MGKKLTIFYKFVSYIIVTAIFSSLFSILLTATIAVKGFSFLSIIIFLIGLCFLIMICIFYIKFLRKELIEPLFKIKKLIQKIEIGDYKIEEIEKEINEEKDVGKILKFLVNVTKELERYHQESMDLSIFLSETFEKVNLLAKGDLSVEFMMNTSVDLINTLNMNLSNLTNSLKKFEEACVEISKGNYEVEVPVRSQKDILSQMFNKMVKDLKETTETLHKQSMDLAILLSDVFEKVSLLSQGDLSVEFSTNTSQDLINALGLSLNNLVSGLKKLAEACVEVGEGNCTVEIPIRSEKDVLGKAFSAMVKNLRELVVKSTQQSDVVLDAASNFTQVSEQATQNISQFASSITQISNATSQISQSIQEITALLNQINKMAQEGKDDVNASMQRITLVDAAVNSAQKAMRLLSQKTEAINEIVSIISKIADQTNLLSLNAAIEAARAGEAGRGFAVVADEIRKLAESSTQQAQKISSIILEVTSGIKESFEITNRGVQELEDTKKAVERSHNIFMDISSLISKAALNAEQISSASEETASMAQEASASTEEQSAAIEEISASAVRLQESANNLKETLAQFKV